VKNKFKTEDAKAKHMSFIFGIFFFDNTVQADAFNTRITRLESCITWRNSNAVVWGEGEERERERRRAVFPPRPES